MLQNNKEEYYFLTEKLEEIDWALRGQCNDIDCNKYIYKGLIKKKYKPVLNHKFSCMNKLKKDKSAILRILLQKRFNKYRYIKCGVCKMNLDKLDNKSVIASFTKKVKIKDRDYYEWKGIWVHRKCHAKIKIPAGWQKFGK
jgi:hypothetical protein